MSPEVTLLFASPSNSISSSNQKTFNRIDDSRDDCAYMRRVTEVEQGSRHKYEADQSQPSVTRRKAKSLICIFSLTMTKSGQV